MEHAFIRAAELGDDAIVILGSPADDVSQGFRSCKKSCVSAKGRRYPAAMPAKELIPGPPAAGGPPAAVRCRPFPRRPCTMTTSCRPQSDAIGPARRRFVSQAAPLWSEVPGGKNMRREIEEAARRLEPGGQDRPYLILKTRL